MAEKAMEVGNKAMQPAYALVNIFPILKYIPAWFPGAGFKRKALEWRVFAERMVEIPFDDVRKKMAEGSEVPSLVLNSLRAGEDPEDVKWVSGTLYVTGADTIHGLLCAFILAMVSNPGIQRKAQAEIDQVVGNDRLPGFEDRTNLPYVECIIKETLRWSTISPLAAPHRVLEDDHYEGYWIPRGSTVLTNLWAIAFDESTYEDPKRFKPERYEDGSEGALDPYLYGFGFGRRICPGMHYADSMIYIVIASVLATFNISKPRNDDGDEIRSVLFNGVAISSQPLQVHRHSPICRR